jgi:glycosyltransferase involved in cell wall biosynthesis
LASDWYAPRRGGIEMHLRDLAERLVAAGHELSVITSTPAERGAPGDDGSIVVRRLAAPRLPLAEVVFSPSVAGEIARLLEEERIDLVHSHVSIVSPVAYAAAWAARRRGIPVVVTFHSMIPRLSQMMAAFDRVTRFSEWGVVPTAVSSAVARAVAPLAPEGTGVELLPNGIYSKQWRVERVAAPPRTLRLVSAMRLEPKKRPRALVSILDRVRRQVGGGIDVTLTLAGDGSSRASVERATAAAGLEGSFRLPGHVGRDELRELYARSDLFVLPTRMEAYGLAALEARAAGLPVAAMRGTGVEDFIEDGRDGWLVADDRALADTIARLARDRRELDAVAAHNADVAARNDWSEVLPHHLELYARAART